MNRVKTMFLFCFLFGISSIYIGMMKFNSEWVTVIGLIISMLSALLYAISDLIYQKREQEVKT